MGHLRNRRGEGVRLRADVLAAATGLLDQGGERAVTLRAVAREAGIAAPSIYPHFPCQQAILRAVVHAAFAELTDHLEAAVIAAGEDTAQRLYAACHAYLDFAAAHPQRYRTMFSLAGQRDLDVPILQLFADVLTDCAAAGRSASTDPATDAVALWLGLHGLAHQRSVIHTFFWSAEIVPRLVTALALVNQLPARPSPQPLP
ncbi:AcrR family transcriptional regulator [Kibdelosporangium banguiense]|uniref:AcrR family transcriptional regulator n=1 Tax=Kibdelosporangium banguiense TaxID=1365924 RepID=A0ABS4TFF2_9PSEU|nr:TetR/AcrR family transcriptional regulator [Kibdelosporangium banguiense]MBP2322805.1 AcrR family transcriptional regulator [Kibdelosporangium banguiense]